MGWKKNRKKGELAFEGGFFGLPLINELSSAFVDVLGVTGQAGSDVVNVLQKPVTGTDLEDIAITENVSLEDLAKLATEVLATGGTSLVKNAPKAASLVDDIVKNVGNKTVTVPVPTSVGSVSGGAKVKIKDIANTVKEQIAPLSLGGKEGSFTRKFINTTMLPISGRSGTLYSKFNYPKFPYFQTSKGTMADYLVTGTKNIPSAVGNIPTAFLQSSLGTFPTSYAMYRGLTDESTLNPDDYYAWTNMLQNTGLGLQDYYMKYSTDEEGGFPVADYVTYPTLNLFNTLTRKEDSPLAKEIEKQVTQNYLSSANTLPPTAKNVNIDSLREAQGNLKFNPEQIDKLNTINEINKDIKEQVDSIKSKTYNFNLNNLK